MEVALIFNGNRICAIIEKPLGIDSETILKHYLGSVGILRASEKDDWRVECGPLIRWSSLENMFTPFNS